MKMSTTPNQPKSFEELLSHMRGLLETHEPSSEEVTSALDMLRTLYPVPGVEIVSKEIWPEHYGPCIYIQNHLKSTPAEAIARLKAMGHHISSEDEHFLKLIITHPWGHWSATYASHMDDAWMKHFRLRHPHLKGLVPILDSMTYTEELNGFPSGYRPGEPKRFLLATPDAYFIHVYENYYGADYLLCAGNTLEEVYEGLKNRRDAESCDDMWDAEEESDVLFSRERCKCFKWYPSWEIDNFPKWTKETLSELKESGYQDLCKYCSDAVREYLHETGCSGIEGESFELFEQFERIERIAKNCGELI